jgi:trimeric autotransporter adhesin
MFDKRSRFPKEYSAAKSRLFCLSLLTLAVCASSSWAQAPSVVIDAQQTLGNNYKTPQSMVVSKNGTVFVADTGNNLIQVLDPFPPQIATNTPALTPGITLVAPQGLALDANGDLFVADEPTPGVGRIVELTGDGNGNLTGAAHVVFSGAPLKFPAALTVNSAGTLFIGDCPLYPAQCGGAIYTLNTAAPATPQPLPITKGLPSQYFPSAFLTDSSSNLYIADNGDGKTNIYGGVYVVPAIGGVAKPVSTGLFFLNGPTGLAENVKGDLYILSFLGTTGSSQEVVIIPAASPTTPYILPNTNLGLSSAGQFDPEGNLDVADYANGAVVQLSSPNPVNLGSIINVGKTGTPVQFNFEYNAPVTLRGFQIVTQGDVSTEVIEANGGSCTNGSHTNLGSGGPAISPYFPYTCTESFYGSPRYPGLRSSAIQVKGTGGTILASTPVYQTGFAGVEVTYPLDQTITATGLQQPQAIAISGLNNTVYVSDSQSGKVYSNGKNGGLGGGTLTPVSTGTVTLTTPLGLALDGAGNLFIADYDGAQIVEVPTTTGRAPSVVNTGGLLKHPLALAFDYVGNLYIGDAGPAGINASQGEPGYIVKIPVGGTPFILPIPSTVPIVFPQALSTDPYTTALLIGDAGDPAVGIGQVVQLYANGTVGGQPGDLAGVTNPSGLVFDQAEQLYVLDATANTITVVPGPTSTQPVHVLEFDNSKLTAASGFANSAGGQSFVIANLGGPGTSNLVRLNGNRSTLAFGSVTDGTQSQPLTALVYNIGNLNMTLGSPYYTTNGANPAFSILGSSFCDNGNFLAPSWSCNIDVEFTPQHIGQTTQQLTVHSNGYNGGSGVGTPPVLVLQGTGAAAPSVKKKK